MREQKDKTDGVFTQCSAGAGVNAAGDAVLELVRIFEAVTYYLSVFVSTRQ